MKKYDLFICYSREDFGIANEICKVLEEYKKRYTFKYFIDCKGITSKHDYVERISTAIAESNAMLFLASKNSLNSTFCLKELLFADNQHIDIYQYRLDNYEYPNTIKLLLGNLHYREASNFSIEDMIKEILCGILKEEISPLSNFSKEITNNTNLHKMIINHETFFVNGNGASVIKSIWREVNEFQEGLACILDHNGKYGYINTTGEQVIPSIP